MLGRGLAHAQTLTAFAGSDRCSRLIVSNMSAHLLNLSSIVFLIDQFVDRWTETWTRCRHFFVSQWRTIIKYASVSVGDQEHNSNPV